MTHDPVPTIDHHSATARKPHSREHLTHKDETPGVQAEGSKVFTDRQRSDFASLGVSDQARDATPFAALQAHFAHAGWIVTNETGGVINATRWGHTRSFDSVQDLRAFAKQIGATHG